MFSERANPDGKKPFAYREGSLFRFRKAHLAGGKRPHTYCVRHLWQCGICSEKYTLAFQEGWGVVMTLQSVDLPEEQDPRRFVAVA
jgi:hypothetical protein